MEYVPLQACMDGSLVAGHGLGDQGRSAVLFSKSKEKCSLVLVRTGEGSYLRFSWWTAGRRCLRLELWAAFSSLNFLYFGSAIFHGLVNFTCKQRVDHRSWVSIYLQLFCGVISSEKIVLIGTFGEGSSWPISVLCKLKSVNQKNRILLHQLLVYLLTVFQTDFLTESKMERVLENISLVCTK